MRGSREIGRVMNPVTQPEDNLNKIDDVIASSYSHVQVEKLLYHRQVLPLFSSYTRILLLLPNVCLFISIILDLLCAEYKTSIVQMRWFRHSTATINAMAIQTSR